MKRWVKFDKENSDKVFLMWDSKNPTFMKRLGFEEEEIEESEKGGWYRKGTAPKFTQEELSQKQLDEFKNERLLFVSDMQVEVDGMKFNG